MTDPYVFDYDEIDGADALREYDPDEFEANGPVTMPLVRTAADHVERVNVPPPSPPSPMVRFLLGNQLESPWREAAEAAVAGVDPTLPAYEAISLQLAGRVTVTQKERKAPRDYGMTLDTALATEPKPRTYVVDQIIPAGGPALMVGRSGIGKTPLLFQLGMSVALGKPFLGHVTRQTPVLYIDAETSEEAANEYFRSISAFLGVKPGQKPPFTFYSINFHDWHTAGATHQQKTEELVRDLKPGLVIFDCLRPLWPLAERSNEDAQAFWRYQRHLSNTYGCATLTVHHVRKPVTDPKTGAAMGVRVQDDVREWLNNTSGSSALITQAESRLAVDFHTARDETRLVIGGFTKARESMAPLVFDRVYNDDGDAIGYEVNTASAWEALPDDDKLMFGALPQSFRHKDVMTQFPGKSKSTIQRALDRLKHAGKLVQLKDKSYAKVG